MGNNRYYNKKKKRDKEEITYIPPYDAALLQESIETLGLSPALLSKLTAGKVAVLLDVAKRCGKDFYKIHTFNKKDLFELEKAVSAKGIRFRPEPEIVKEETAEGADAERPQNAQKPNRQSQPQTDNRNKNKQNKDTENRRNGAQNDRNQRNGNKQQQQNSSAIAPSEPKRQRPKREVVVIPQDKYVKMNRNNKWGFSDRSGKEVIKPVYDEVFTFKDELCCAEKDELYGFIDRNGEEVIPFVYECAASFSEGYACVYKNGHCGYINKANDVVVDFKFDAGTQVTDGSCRIKKDGKWGEMTVETAEIRWIN